jgi:hypothetical protein
VCSIKVSLYTSLCLPLCFLRRRLSGSPYFIHLLPLSPVFSLCVFVFREYYMRHVLPVKNGGPISCNAILPLGLGLILGARPASSQIPRASVQDRHDHKCRRVQDPPTVRAVTGPRPRHLCGSVLPNAHNARPLHVLTQPWPWPLPLLSVLLSP